MKDFDDVRTELQESDPVSYMKLEIAGTILAYRDQLKLSEDQLAKECDISKEVLRHLESGEGSVDMDSLLKVVDKLGCNLMIVKQED